MSWSKNYLLLMGMLGVLFIVMAACASPQASEPSQGVETMEQQSGAEMEEKDGMMEDKKDGAMEKKAPDSAMMKLPHFIKAAHFVDSSPKHGDRLALAPERIMLNFDFTLHEISSIRVTKDGAPVETGEAVLGSDGLSMSATLGMAAGNGLYVVSYTACWPDRSCHDGQFGFIVDENEKMSYQDMTGESEVQIVMRDLTFQPSRLIVSRGTVVIWKNEDSVPHFVNSDPHPSHNVLPALNSLTIGDGQEYVYKFSEVGEWAFHCSAHYPDGMVGRIIVV